MAGNGSDDVRLTHEGISDLIVSKMPELMESLELDPLFLAALQGVGVITTALMDQLKVASLTGNEKVGWLMHSVQVGSVQNFLNFCKVLNDPTHGKQHVLEILGPDAMQAVTSKGDDNTGLTPDDIKDLILSRKSIIMQRMEPGLLFVARLQAVGVVTASLMDQLNVVPSLTRHQKIQLILDSVAMRGVQNFNKFCQVLNDPAYGQEHVLVILGDVAKHAAAKWKELPEGAIGGLSISIKEQEPELQKRVKCREDLQRKHLEEEAMKEGHSDSKRRGRPQERSSGSCSRSPSRHRHSYTYARWDRRNNNEQKLVTDSKYGEILDHGEAMLKSTLRVEDICFHLQQLRVVDTKMADELKSDTSNSSRVERLLTYLRTCETWKFHGLMRACALGQQSDLICKLGLDNQKYLPATKVYCPGMKDPISGELLAGITEHCENCRRVLMKRTLFDLGEHHKAEQFDVAKCYISINPKSKGDSGTLIEIEPADIFRRRGDDEPPRSIRLYGESGAGKSVFTLNIAYEWSWDFLNSDGALPEDGWTLVVYIPAREIKGTIEESIRAHLCCKSSKTKDVLMDHVKNGHRVAIIIDAVDELRDKVAMELLSEYVHENYTRGGPTILLSARTDLCDIHAGWFSRFLVLQGFSDAQGNDYIERFFDIPKFRDAEIQQQVLNFVHCHQEKMAPVVRNPLKLHLFCAVTSMGLLKLTDKETFNIVELFMPLEMHLLTREGGSVDPDKSERFYQMCMYAMLKGMRDIPESLLKEYNIDAQYYVFLEKCSMRDPTDKVTFTFQHEMIYEYLASRVIESLSFKCRKALILSICCETSLRNIQKIVLQFLKLQEHDNKELITTLLRSIILFQHQDEGWTLPHGWKQKLLKRRTFYDKQMLLRKKVQVVLPIDSLMTLISDKRQCKVLIKKAKKLWGKVNAAFEECPDGLKKCLWYQGLANGTLGHVTGCLQGFNTNVQQQFAEQSLDHILPCQREDKDGDGNMTVTVDRVGHSRWGEVKVYVRHTEVHGWCVGDVCDLLEQYKVKRAHWYYCYMYIDTYRDVWGTPGHNTWTHDVWQRLLQVYSHTQTVVWLDIQVDETTPLTGLLTCIPDTHLGVDTMVRVYNGTVSLEDLVLWLDTCVQTRVRLYLYDTRVVVPHGGDEYQVGDMKVKVCQVKNSRGDTVLCDTEWVTESGAHYVW